MSDLISRQAVIDALEKVAELYPWRVPGDRDSYSPYNEAWQDALNRVENEIEALPSAQPERKKGKWQWLSSTYDRVPCEMRYRCSECHHETITHSNGMSEPWEKFCPNCGAKMGEQNETD